MNKKYFDISWMMFLFIFLVASLSPIFCKIELTNALISSDTIKIIYPNNNCNLCVGTKMVLRFDANYNAINRGPIVIEISKNENPDSENDNDWINLTYVTQVIDVNNGKFSLEIKQEYLNPSHRKIRVRTSYTIIGEKLFDEIWVNIVQEPVLQSANWIDNEPIGSRKPLIFIHGIGLSYKLSDPLYYDCLPEEKSWDNLLLYMKKQGIFKILKPYIFMYDSNDTDDTFLYNMSNRDDYGIKRIADNLANLVESSFDFNNKNICIISHSMGGLVARQFMTSTNIGNLPTKEKIDNIITIFTPHRGSPLANFPPDQLEVNIGKSSAIGNSKFLEDISWDGYKVLPVKNIIERFKKILVVNTNPLFLTDDGEKTYNQFLLNLNNNNNNIYNWKIIPYAGNNPIITYETGIGKIDKILNGLATTYFLSHWSVINQASFKSVGNNFIYNDGVVTSDSASGTGLQMQNCRFYYLHHLEWTNGSSKCNQLYNDICYDILKKLTPPPICDFSLTTSQPNVEVTKGNKATYTIQVNQLGNQASQVKLYLVGSPTLPAGSYTISPSIASIGGTATITINTTKCNLATYNLTVTGVACSKTKVLKATMKVIALPDENCDLEIVSFEPTNAKCGEQISIKITLNTAISKVTCSFMRPDGIKYDEFEFIKKSGNIWTNNFGVPNDAKTEGTWTLQFSITCNNNKVYIVKKNINISCEKPVVAVPVPMLPINNSTVYTREPKLEWSCKPPQNLKGYEIGIYPTIQCDENNFVDKCTVSNKTHYYASNLQIGKTYYWKVRCVINDDQEPYGKWSLIYSFKVDQKSPDKLITSAMVIFHQNDYSGELPLYDRAYNESFDFFNFQVNEECLISVELYKDKVNLGTPFWKTNDEFRAFPNRGELYNTLNPGKLPPGKYWWRYKARWIDKEQDWTWVNEQKNIASPHFILEDYIPEPTAMHFDVTPFGQKYTVLGAPIDKNTINVRDFKISWSVDIGTIERITIIDTILEHQIYYIPSGNDYYANITCYVNYRGKEYGPFTYKLKVGNPPETNKSNHKMQIKNYFNYSYFPFIPYLQKQNYMI